MVDLTDESLTTEVEVAVFTADGGYMTDAYLRAGSGEEAWLRPRMRLASGASYNLRLPGRVEWKVEITDNIVDQEWVMVIGDDPPPTA